MIMTRKSPRRLHRHDAPEDENQESANGPSVAKGFSPEPGPGSRPRRRAQRVSYVYRDEEFDEESDNVDGQGTPAPSAGASDTSDYEYASVGEIEDSEGDGDVQEDTATDDMDEDMDEDQDEVASDNMIMGEASMKSTTPKKKATRKTKSGGTVRKDIDFDLPPLSRIEDIFADMLKRALELGLAKALPDRPINVATMCSGTESPLLALELLSEALRKQNKQTGPSIRVNHRFSAEIDVVKQGYIERNFKPKKLFRDVREIIPEGAVTATTAFGSEETIDGELDILIAGFVCKDLSGLNNRRKGLRGDGESGDTWSAIYSYAQRFRPSIVLVENVRDEAKTWDSLEEDWSMIGYEYAWMYCNTKKYYLPQTRIRMYMIAIDKKHFGKLKDTGYAVQDWKRVMKELQRPCSSPFDAFLSGYVPSQEDYSSLGSETDWPFGQLRYAQIRSNERLGLGRPVTGWNESGFLCPPDFANYRWYQSQSTRVYDCIEIAHLQEAQKGLDFTSKMMVFDVSQNAGRFKVQNGILPCITPGGCLVISNRQVALTGGELLVLQGMPYSKLLFSGETQKDRQDLAGNAMSTTVIGAAIVSALICGSKSFRTSAPSDVDALKAVEMPHKPQFIPPKLVSSQVVHPPLQPEKLSLDQLVQDAKYSSRMCNCEGSKLIAKSPIQICKDCAHTACSSCAGNPTHTYGPTVAREARILSPVDFEAKWRARLPARLRFTTFPCLKTLDALQGIEDQWKAFQNLVDGIDITAQYFTIGNFQCLENMWKITFDSKHATLELRIKEATQWCLFVRCPSSTAGNNMLREIVAQPLARGLVKEMLLQPTWELLLPMSTPCLMEIQGSSKKVSSWRSWLGLPDYQEEEVPATPEITSTINELSGRYTSLDKSWRPWSVNSTIKSRVDARVPGTWVPEDITLVMDYPSIVASTALSLPEHSHGDCSQALIILAIEIQAHLKKEYLWALEQVKALPDFTGWEQVGTDCSRKCACAPSWPRVIWHVDDEGSATPQEDRKAAAHLEHAIKHRPAVISIQRRPESTSETFIEIGLNVSSLVHRAANRLGSENPHVAKEPFDRFRLRGNSSDSTYTGLHHFKKTLSEAQRRSLAWMRSQEAGVALVLSEIEEEVHNGLGWRVEARAESTVTLRGGVLADMPSFGKTVTTISLVESEFEQNPEGAVLSVDSSLAAGLPSLINIAATLIVCPPLIAPQWRDELKECLGEQRYQSYNESRFIIVSWKVLADEKYITSLARFSAMPEPALGRTTASRGKERDFRGRAFDAWLDYSMKEMPDRVETLLNSDPLEFAKELDRILRARLESSEFNAVVPQKVKHGSAYVKSKNAPSASAKPKPKPKVNKVTSRPGSTRNAGHFHPLLQMFQFNRLVVDEYHYLYQDKNFYTCAIIQRLSSLNQWILSGTPLLSNFTDVNQIASFFGIRLGRDVLSDAKVTTEMEKQLLKGQTDVEKFFSKTETMSYQWHRARHHRAQHFLDNFARQNEPSLQHVSCIEELRPVTLSAAHNAVYLELSQHLIAQKMQIKRLNKSTADRAERLNGSLNNSATAEEALVKSALLFKEELGDSGLDKLKEKRQEQRQSTEAELLGMMKEAEGYLRHGRAGDDEYSFFKRDIKAGKSLADGDARRAVKRLLENAELHPATRKGVTIDKTNTTLKTITSQTGSLLQELTLRQRSTRSIESIQAISSGHVKPSTYHCSAHQCEGTNISNDESCVQADCHVPVQMKNLIKSQDLGSVADDRAETSFGKKLDAISRLMNGVPKSDQVIVFAPNEGIIDDVKLTLNHFGIKYHAVSKSGVSATRDIEDFKTNKDPHKRKKVLILNLSDESASGLNLQNANHIIFVSPLLVATQREYDSAMTQAIARSRRYGQKKKVHVYHFAALRTIDVDILEHRQKRSDSIHSPGSSINMPRNLPKKQRTKVVRSHAGSLALVPVSWLADRAGYKDLGLPEELESFRSLISFSETFEGDDSEE
ncbi:hypothetical protein BDV95DRAFT_674447 [Massariosphaeria phaeospora]|uniref:Helicase C-terminal domain-containing protein n=1 Tax=Massariosphaeria phaeospora TaxID=100035 RepID=A0A7C8MLV3_9PLEO|nr:hypothetical protein BDV95DRAFT_674447 [Massariosphaeria phaeospora]